MNLALFAGPDEIFVDANIFTYFALGTERYQDACADFLTRVEQDEIHAVTSDFVLFVASLETGAALNLRYDAPSKARRTRRYQFLMTSGR